jgi:hypothetical protein
MDARQAILSTKTMSQTVLTKYISDLSDADLMLRPGKGCNHLAWQLGHLIKSECELLNSLVPGSAPALPAGFAEKHEKAKAGSDNASDFCTKAEYLDLIKQMNDAFTTTIKAVTDADLDQPAPENLRSWFPTAGQVWLLVATHQLMHAGQFVPVRRSLGKPVLI